MGASLPGQMMMMARAGMIVPAMEYIYPFHLGQFGLSAKAFYRHPVQAWKAADAFLEQEDSAAYELSVDGAKALNDTIKCMPGVYYFSYAGQATAPDAEGNQVPTDAVWSMFKSSSAAIGKKRPAFTTPGGVRIDDKWLPNDGLVNLVSAQYPFGEPHKKYDQKKIERGVWQVMPTVAGFDHADFGGGMQKLGGKEGFKELQMGVVGILEKLG